MLCRMLMLALRLMLLEIRSKVNINMFITEFFNSTETPQFNEKDDQSVLSVDDTRKVRLTLRHLNRLRSSNDIRKFENEQKATDIAQQYTPSDAGGDAAALA